MAAQPSWSAKIRKQCNLRRNVQKKGMRTDHHQAAIGTIALTCACSLPSLELALLAAEAVELVDVGLECGREVARPTHSVGLLCLIDGFPARQILVAPSRLGGLEQRLQVPAKARGNEAVEFS